MLFPILINGQKLSVDEFEERLGYERGNYAIQNYDQNKLNRPGYVWGMLKSNEDNLIYMASNRGILEYDGKDVRRVQIKEDTTYRNVMGLARTLVQLDDGTIYVTGDRRFGKLVTNKYGLKEFEYLLHKLPDSIDYRRQIIWGSLEIDNKIYMNTPNFIFRWDGEKFDRIWKFSDYSGGRSSKGKIHAFSKVDNVLYTRRWGYGIYKMENDQFQFIEGTEIFADNRIELFYENSNNDVLLFSRQLGVYILDKDGKLSKSDNETLNNWLVENGVYVQDDLKPFSDGSIPIHSRGGLLIIDENLKILNNINIDDGLESNEINSSFIDENDILYLPTTTGMSIVNLNNSLTQYDKNNGIDGYVWAPIKRINGDIYFGSTIDLYRLITEKNPMKNNLIKRLNFNDMMRNFHQFDNSVIGTHNYGLSEYIDGKVKIISSDYDVGASAQSKLNKSLLFVQHPLDGLLIMKRDFKGKFQIIKTLNPIKGKGISGFIELEPGKLVVNTPQNSGSFIAEYDYNANFEFTRLIHPLKDSILNSLTDSLNINSQKLPDSTFNYIETKIGYLALSDSGTVHKIDLINKKLINFGINIPTILDSAGWNSRAYNSDSETNWFFSDSLIYETVFSDSSFKILNRFKWGQINNNELTGRVFVEGTGKNETVWFGSQDSKLIRWLPKNNLSKNNNDLRPLLRGFYINNKLHILSKNKIEYDSSRSIKFEYSFPSYNREENNEFKVFLKGQDSDWSDWSKNSFREYTNLPEKNYEFFIQSRDTNGNESEVISFSFTILPPWYRTYAAYAGYIFLLVFGFRSFGKYQAKKSLEKADNERRAGELEEAKKIQESMLPKVFPTSNSYDISAGLVTSTEIGGDYYDFFENKNSIYAVCGDATGHGTSSGMMVSIIKSGLNGLPSLSTDKVLYELNNIVKKIDLGTLKMSLNICEIKNGSITLSSAAMPPIYLYNSKSKKTEEILIRGLPLGGLKNETFDIQKKKFNKGDVLVMLSDGLPEAENDAGELYDYERVMELINKNASKTAEEIKDKMIGEVDIWLDGKVPDDDVSIVVIKKNS